MTTLRRVVTGDVDGTSVFVSDGPVQGAAPAALQGMQMHALWGGDRAPAVPNDGRPESTTGWFAPPGGYRFISFTLPPDSEVAAHPGHPDPSAGRDEVEAAFPGLLGFSDSDGSGIHATPTLDLDVVVSGQVVLELSDGATTTLGPGDTVVLNGARHRWSNPGDVPAVVMCVFIGAAPDES